MTDVFVTLLSPCLCPSEGYKHGVSIQSSINYNVNSGDILPWIARKWKIAETWFLARLFINCNNLSYPRSPLPQQALSNNKINSFQDQALECQKISCFWTSSRYSFCMSFKPCYEEFLKAASNSTQMPSFLVSAKIMQGFTIQSGNRV